MIRREFLRRIGAAVAFLPFLGKKSDAKVFVKADIDSIATTVGEISDSQKGPKWRRWGNPDAQVAPLIEGVDPAPILLSKTDIQVKPKEYGAYIVTSS